jgi:hypothetical protein
MQLDMTRFPIIWMRGHDEDDHQHEDIEAQRDALVALLDGGQKFVLVADRLPTLGELTDIDPIEKKMRAQLFKTYRLQLTQLCAGMIMVGNAASLPEPLRKVMEAFTGMLGVPVLFAASAEVAETMARDRLAFT